MYLSPECDLGYEDKMPKSVVKVRGFQGRDLSTLVHCFWNGISRKDCFRLNDLYSEKYVSQKCAYIISQPKMDD